MKFFKDLEEERRFWVKLSVSDFWPAILDVIEDRISEIESLLDDPRVPRDNDPRLFGRLMELKWVKKLPEAFLNSAELASLAKPEEEKEEVKQRLVGNPDKGTGII